MQRTVWCRSRRELSNECLLFTCKSRLRYSRERALKFWEGSTQRYRLAVAADFSEAVRAALVVALWGIANRGDTVATDAMAACLRNESEADRADVLECFALRNECDSHRAIVMVEKRQKFVTFTRRMEELLEGYDRGTLWRDPAHVRIYSLMRRTPNNIGLRVEYAEHEASSETGARHQTETTPK